MSSAETTAHTPAPTEQVGRRSALGLLGRGMGHVLRVAVPVAICLAFFVPLLTDSLLTLQVFIVAFLNASVVASLVASLGYAGVPNFSQATFYGLGAYTAAILVADHDWTFLTAAIAAIFVAAGGGLLLGLVTKQLSGDYFVLVSLGVTIGVAQLMENLPNLTRGREGFFGLPRMSLAGLDFNDPVHSYYLCLGLLALVYLLSHRLFKGFYGTAMLVVRHDELAARSMGISPTRVRVTSMVLSSGMAGLCGAFLVGSIQFISPSDFDFDASFLMSLYVIIGGMASLPGAVTVSFVFTYLNQQLRGLSDYSLGLVGIAVLVMVFIRGGVVRDWLERLGHRLSKGAGRRA